jgi:transcriptional regulator with XRE-family HTH domain
MAASSSPPVARLQLGRELRRLREGAQVSRETAAAELECGISKISKVETGKATLRAGEVKVLLDLYRVTERDTVQRLARDARKRSLYRVPDWAKSYVGMEADAAEIRTYEAELIPGLLQTEAYAREVIRAADPNQDPREVERLVEARSDRQRRLTTEDAPLLWAIISEAVIRRVVDDHDVMHHQLDHLTTAAGDTYPNVTIQVLPFSAGAHAAMGSSFVHLRLADPPDAETVYLEDLTSADYVVRPSNVARYLAAFGMLTNAALTPQKSTLMIRQASEDLLP